MEGCEQTILYGRGLGGKRSKEPNRVDIKSLLLDLSEEDEETAEAFEEEVDPGIVDGLSIIKYPDPRLRAHNEEISYFKGYGLTEVVGKMWKLMYKANGVGLAAPQVGINKRLMVFNESGNPRNKSKEMVLLNPQIVARGENERAGPEGCLSFPGVGGQVKRSTSIQVEYQTLTGEKKKREFRGFEAVVFQHEYDHLDGVLFIDRLFKPDEVEKAEQPLQVLKDDWREKTGTEGAL
uniref:Peptide deformylase n=1 Tax=Chromera velia CCMP2878 TaxID=1169474 RepID=A0A0G4HD43_9ALVE|eukprot:Cvel_26382.t1-p1 / transcript=Cvel_26382.t1 / gene=Cvel_26382 / organism=Chromera_velia_CCMP2878 / gene_product=Peptide deformylase 1B, chloroplastic/mitochondrial, putative / transcript_product=Peptide deformylase 1B, chloroplastic/mitochondrial, putative / location=Cvel_scaffold3128:245-2262(-) / protein_length=235 / sequence_SO=supercontig / SO=protein_coding / is_pseudo=false